MRTEAQKAADKRYATKNKNAQKTIGFRLPTAEAEAIEAAIAQSGLSKVAFLRRAVIAFEKGVL